MPALLMRPTRLAALVASGAALAIGVLVWDHFNRQSLANVILATLILIVATALLIAALVESHRARREASTAEALRSASTQAALDCVISIDQDSIVREWNPAAEKTFGYTREEAIGNDLGSLIIPPEHRAKHHRGVNGLGTSGTSPLLDRRVEVTAIHRNGHSFPVELTATRIQNDPPMFTAFVRDLSDQRRQTEENERLASIVRSSEDAILSKDLEGVVTAWNHGAQELYGYTSEEAVGRTVLELIVPAERVAEVNRVLARTTAGASVAMTTQRHTKDGRLLDVSLRSFPIRDVTGKIIGASVSAHDITDRRRREELEQQDHIRRLWQRRTREAMANDRLLFYGQPVVHASSGDLHHHELLLRMDLDGKIIGPQEFLPYAEDSELILEVDEWVINRSLELARGWRVAINLSGKSLSNMNIISWIAEGVAKFETPPANLIFEITETAAAENLDAATEMVEQLRELGCDVALDDFGTGYGSFTYLKHLPVTELKIDMSFIRGLRTDEVDQRVVKSIISVAGTFDMRTVAEGVEDEATASLLREMGVDLLQGYHLGRPAPIGLSASVL